MTLQQQAERPAAETPQTQQPESGLTQQKSIAAQAEAILNEALNPGAVEEPEPDEQHPGESQDDTQDQDNSRPPTGDGDATDDAEPLDQEDDVDEPGESQQQPTKLKDLAEKLQVEVADLYNIEIPLGDGSGESMTLGELKDEVLGHEDLTEAKSTFEVEQMQARSELAKLATALQMVGQLPPEAAQALEQIQLNEQAYESQQRVLMYHARKEWQDRDTFLADRDRIMNHLQKHGLGYLAQGGVKSAPFMLYLDRMAKMEETHSKAKANRKRLQKLAKEQTGSKVKVPGKRRYDAQSRYKQSGNKMDQLAAVEEVLGNANVNVHKANANNRIRTRANKRGY